MWCWGKCIGGLLRGDSNSWLLGGSSSLLLEWPVIGTLGIEL